MSSTHVALIRGINVGRAKRVAMADLRALVAGLGYGDVRTLLNSGNVVFTVPSGARRSGDPAARIEEAMTARLGFSARVTVLTAEEVAAAVRENPLRGVADDPSRLLVAVLADRVDAARLRPLLQQDWAPDRLAVADGAGARVAYIWCPGGVLASRLVAAFGRALGDAATTRNLTTMSKLAAIAAGPGPTKAARTRQS